MAKITFVLPTLNISGGIRVAVIHAENLRKMGHDVFVIAPPPPPPSFRRKLLNLVNLKQAKFHHSDAAKFADNSDLEVQVLPEYRPVLDSDVPDADFVIATWWETVEWVWDLSDEKGKKVHFVQGHEVFDYLPVERATAVLHLPIQKIVISEWLKEIMETTYKAKNVPIVPNSVDFSEFYSSNRQKNSNPVFGFLYSPVPLKNCIACIRELSRAKEKVPNLRVVVFGREKPSRRLKVPNWMEYHISPSASEIRELYASCDAWLFTSTSEGFGLPILEAMACKTPVIATYAGAAPQLVDSSVGALVENDRDKLFQQIMRYSLMKDSEWSPISQNAFRKAESLSWSDSTALFEKILINELGSDE